MPRTYFSSPSPATMSQENIVENDLKIEDVPKQNIEIGSIKVMKSSSELPNEPAAAFLMEHEHQWGNYDPQDAKKVLRRIDLRLLPLVMGTITIAAVDVSYETVMHRAIN